MEIRPRRPRKGITDPPYRRNETKSVAIGVIAPTSSKQFYNAIQSAGYRIGIYIYPTAEFPDGAIGGASAVAQREYRASRSYRLQAQLANQSCTGDLLVVIFGRVTS